MTRNLKALGLALVALFAFGAIAASGASATNFTAAESPATLMGEQVTGEEHKFIFSAGNKAELTCATATFESPKGKLLEAPGASASLTPNYQGCHAIIAGVTKDVTVTHHECWFEFTTSGEVHIKCPVGTEGIEIHVYNNAADHTPPTDKPICTYVVEPQTVSSVTYTNMTGTPNDVTVKANAVVSVQRTSGSALVCGNVTQNATYTGNTTVRATNEAKATINFHVL